MQNVDCSTTFNAKIKIAKANSWNLKELLLIKNYQNMFRTCLNFNKTNKRTS